jgi:hypothetical protein
VTVTVAVPVVADAEAVKVSVEVALPFAGGVTGLVENPAVTPLGKPVAVNVVAELKLFWLVTVTVLAPVPPCVTVTDEGDAPMVKLGVAPAFTVNAIVVVWVVDPETPEIVTVAAPVVAVPEAVSVKVDVAVPFAGGVTGFVEYAAVTPLGNPVALSVVAELNPFRLVIVIVLVPLEPCVIDNELGEAPIVKSGVVLPHVGNLKLAIRVFQLNVPVVFRYSCVYQNVQSSRGSTCMAL